MIIKKFQGKTEEEAMAAAKKELGDGVVVMNVKQVKRKGIFSIFKPQLIEVTVALEEDNSDESEKFKSAIAAVSAIAQKQEEKQQQPAQGKSSPSDNQKKEQPSQASVTGTKQNAETKNASGGEEKKTENCIEEKLDALQSMLEKQMGQGNSEKEEEKKENTNVAFFKLLYNVMLENEVKQNYANELVDELDKTMKPDMPIDFMLSNVYQKMVLKFGQPRTISPSSKGPKVVFFIGPTGVGKTTTIAKIASKFCVEQKKKVALVTADTYRIAAVEQLRTYANILDVPFRVVYTVPEIQTAIGDFEEYDYVLIDTAGHSHHNAEQRESMTKMIHSVDDKVEKEIYLVVSATTKYRDLVNIADSYSELKGYKLIFTKLDETTTLGNLLNLKLHTGADMSYVTCGQNVPDDIAYFNAQETVKLLLGGGRI